MSGHSLGCVGVGLIAALGSVGCGGDDLRAALYDPSAGYTGYGYSAGAASAGASAWSGYSGVAPTVAAPPPEVRTSVPSVVLHVPRLHYGTEATLSPTEVPAGAWHLATPTLHSPRGRGWHHRGWHRRP